MYIFYYVQILTNVANVMILKLIFSILVYLRAMLFNDHSVNCHSVRFNVPVVICPQMNRRCVFHYLHFVHIL